MSEHKHVLDADELATQLASLGHWSSGDGALHRTFRTSGWKGTLMVVNAIGHLAEAAFHHPDLTVTYDKVVVRLFSHDAGGVTARDTALARMIETVIMWQPGEDPESPLQGPPKYDPRVAYLIYD